MFLFITSGLLTTFLKLNCLWHSVKMADRENIKIGDNLEKDGNETIPEAPTKAGISHEEIKIEDPSEKAEVDNQSSSGGNLGIQSQSLAAPVPTVVSRIKADGQNIFPDAPSVGKHRKNVEPVNPELIFTDKGPDVIETIPRDTARKEDESYDEAERNLFVEDMVEHEDEYASGKRTPVRVLHRSLLRENLSDDEMLRNGVDAFYAKDYFLAKHIFELMVKHDPKNVRARQLRDLIRGILDDRDDGYYLARRDHSAME